MLPDIPSRAVGEDGMSLVEVMVGMLIVTVGLLGLLGVLVTSARAVVEQDLRSRATRVATQELERVRAADADALPIGTTVRERLEGSTAFTVTTDVSWLPGSQDGVKAVTTTVRWMTPTGPRETVMSTGLRSRASAGSPTFGVLHLEGPATAVAVDAGGRPLAPVTLRAVPDGFVHSGTMTVSWTNADRVPGQATLTSDDAVTWTGSLAPADLRVAFAAGDSATLTFTVTAGARNATLDITFTRPPAAPPGAPVLSGSVVRSAGVDGRIAVKKPPGKSGNCSMENCDNVAPVEVAVAVTQATASQVVEAVYVEFDLRDATGRERQALAHAAGGVYRHTFPAGTREFATGTARVFSFVAVHDGGQETRLDHPGGVLVVEQ